MKKNQSDAWAYTKDPTRDCDRSTVQKEPTNNVHTRSNAHFTPSRFVHIVLAPPLHMHMVNTIEIFECQLLCRLLANFCCTASSIVCSIKHVTAKSQSVPKNNVTPCGKGMLRETSKPYLLLGRRNLLSAVSDVYKVLDGGCCSRFCPIVHKHRHRLCHTRRP